jgi:endogenous inhibitor of DNA gyrase (YacG/DUF329 family)
MAAALGGPAPVPCPACGEAMEQRAVPPRSEVSYVRDRVWLVCPGCQRSVVFDRRRLEGT